MKPADYVEKMQIMKIQPGRPEIQNTYLFWKTSSPPQNRFFGIEPVIACAIRNHVQEDVNIEEPK
jgi:hypothetical protein